MEVETIFNSGAWEFTSTVFSIIIVTIMMILFLLYIGKKFKGTDPSKPPTYFQSIVENMYTGFVNYFDGLTRGKLKPFYPYFFTLYFFIFFLSVSDLIGLTPGTANIGVTLTLGLISFIGIYVAGVIGHGLFKFVFHKYKNPIELFAQFSPLLSLSLRLFGSTFAMVLIAKIIPQILGAGPGYESDFMWYIFPFISISYLWAINGFAAALSAIQALVFVTLTIIYWSMELGDVDAKRAKKAQVKAEKKKYKANILETKRNKKKEK